MHLINWIGRVMFEEHKPINDEQTKNKRTHSPMHECHFSLNGKYKNTHLLQMKNNNIRRCSSLGRGANDHGTAARLPLALLQ
jgi:hypothetical protein